MLHAQGESTNTMVSSIPKIIVQKVLIGSSLKGKKIVLFFKGQRYRRALRLCEHKWPVF